MGTREARSYHEQRGARNAALNPKTEIDTEVWKTAKNLEESDVLKIEKKEIERSLSQVGSEIRRMQSDYARKGIRNPRYKSLLGEKTNLMQKLIDLDKRFLLAKSSRRNSDALRRVNAPETFGDVFKRIARMMLADDVYTKIATIADDEWQRLYGT